MSNKSVIKTVMLEPADAERLERIAKADERYYYRGRPSAAAVVRDALALFFAECADDSQHTELKGSDRAA